MTPEQIRERGILQVYSDMQKEYRTILKDYGKQAIGETDIEASMRYMEMKYRDLIDSFKRNNNKYFYDLK